MSSLANRYSNLQIFGFFSLFLTSSIWTYWGIWILKIIFYSNDAVYDLYNIFPMLGIYVGIPLFASLIILHRMKTRKMVTNSNYYWILLAGFTLSSIIVAADYFILK
jgi:hypothetical protein